MKLLTGFVLASALIGGVAALSYNPLQRYWQERNRPDFRTAEVTRGSLESVVNATGTIQPVVSVQVGSFVSGPIIRLHVDFNDDVKQGDLLAEIDPRIYEANAASDRAALARAQAEVKRIQARLQNATNNEQRALRLREGNRTSITESDLDNFKFDRLALEAELIVARASVEQSQANLNNALANLEYTKITSPVDGVVIDRKVDPGQTLASQFQTPELFVVAPDMRSEIHVFASVDETDIGLITQARDEQQPVHFTVDAYPGEVFEGTISQIRLSSTTTQNVVTYPVIVSATNPELKLLPGMTADVSFRIQEKNDVTKIPNSALRFFPPREHVREADRQLIDGDDDFDRDSSTLPPAAQRAQSVLDQRRRHVWVQDGLWLRAVEIVTGISDYRFSELESGEIGEGQQLVVGVQSK